MNNSLNTKTHLVGYVVGIVSTIAGLVGYKHGLGGTETVAATGGGLVVVLGSVITKLLADLGISKATISKDVKTAESILSDYKVIVPMLSKLPALQTLSTKVDALEKDLETKVAAVRSDIQAEIDKLPAAEQAMIQAAIQNLVKAASGGATTAPVTTVTPPTASATATGQNPA